MTAEKEAYKLLTPEELRQNLVKKIDSLIDLPWPLNRSVSAEDRRMLKGLRGFTLDADQDTLNKILAHVNKEPMANEPHNQ